jgi:hypothetical protein
MIETVVALLFFINDKLVDGSITIKKLIME